jgi:anti-sigma factor RsiW
MKRFDEDDRLHALIDGEVEPDIRAELEALLYDDPTLRGRFDEHARHKAGLREAAADLAAAGSSSSLKTHRLTLRLRTRLGRVDERHGQVGRAVITSGTSVQPATTTCWSAPLPTRRWARAAMVSREPAPASPCLMR